MSIKNVYYGYVKQPREWLKSDQFSPRRREMLHRMLNITRYLALCGSKNIFQIQGNLGARGDKSMNYTTVLRYVNNLEGNGLIEICTGTRNARICTITSRGLLITFIQHYLSEEEILEAICTRSPIISTLRQIGFNEDKLRSFFKFSVWKYLLALSPSMTFLEQEQLYDPEDSDYQKASDELYGNIIWELEFHIISDAADYIGSQGFSKLSSEDFNELREKAENALVIWMNLLESTQKHIEKTRTLLDYLETPI